MASVRKTRSAARSLKNDTLGVVSSSTRQSPAPSLVFAPNVTPGSYLNDGFDDCDPAADDESGVFRPLDTDTPVLPMNRKRRGPRERRPSQGHVPRPCNAFILFRRALLGRQFVNGSFDSSGKAGHLSKVVGQCWRALPQKDKQMWYAQARKVKEQHIIAYPNYRFTPVHRRNPKGKRKQVKEEDPDQEEQSERVARLMLEGRMGDEFSAAVKEIEEQHCRATPSAAPSARIIEQPIPTHEPMGVPRREWVHRRSSSVPLLEGFASSSSSGIALPSIPFFTQQHLQQEMDAHSASTMLYGRRPSSAGSRPIGQFNPADWTRPTFPPAPRVLQRDDSPLPDVTPGLFSNDWSFTSASSSNATNDYSLPQYHHQVFNPRNELPPLGPLDVGVAPHEMLSASSYAPSPASLGAGWQYGELSASSHTSSTYSGSPTRTPEMSDLPLPMQNLSIAGGATEGIVSPQPLATNEMPTMQSSDAPSYEEIWKGFTTGKSFSLGSGSEHQYDHQQQLFNHEDLNMFVANGAPSTYAPNDMF